MGAKNKWERGWGEKREHVTYTNTNQKQTMTYKVSICIAHSIHYFIAKEDNKSSI